MMIFYGTGWLLWMLYFVYGHDGGTIHMIWWKFSQVSALGVLLTLILTIVAQQSYGTRDEVSNSWFGTTLTVNNGVATLGTNTLSGWISDYKYLLFKDQDSVPIPYANYSMGASFA